MEFSYNGGSPVLIHFHGIFQPTIYSGVPPSANIPDLEGLHVQLIQALHPYLGYRSTKETSVRLAAGLRAKSVHSSSNPVAFLWVQKRRSLKQMVGELGEKPLVEHQFSSESVYFGL